MLVRRVMLGFREDPDPSPFAVYRNRTGGLTVSETGDDVDGA